MTDLAGAAVVADSAAGTTAGAVYQVACAAAPRQRDAHALLFGHIVELGAGTLLVGAAHLADLLVRLTVRAQALEAR